MTHRWTEKSDVLAIFPTLVWNLQLTPSIREPLNVRILDVLAELRPTGTDPGHSRGWQSRQNLHELASFEDLVAYIHENAATIFKSLNIGHEGFAITACWANINPPGAAHAMHSHPNNFLSGVYYVQTQAGADTINFHDPRIQAGIIRPPVTELTTANTDQVVVKVDSGTLLFFPSYLPHSVAVNDSLKERVSLSFNIMFSSFTETMSTPLW